MAINIFIAYAQEDRALAEQLQIHLQILQQDQLIGFWSALNISIDNEWKQTVETGLSTADIMLFLISQYALNLDYYYSSEIKRAIERHERGEVRAISILLRPVYYERTPLALLPALPTGAKPVITWQNLEEAFSNVFEGIQKVVKELHPDKSSPLQAKSVKVFISYDRKDEIIFKELEKRLHYLERQGFISLWNDSTIQAGREWNQEIEKHLHSSQIVLLLISPDFIASDKCYKNEMVQAMKMHDAGEARVIPIILRPVTWDDQPFSKLQILPSGGKPLKRWSNIDEAFVDVLQNIKNVVLEILTEQYLAEADEFERDNRLEEALALIDEAMFLGLSSARIHLRRGNILFIRRRYEEALASYDETIRLDPNTTVTVRVKTWYTASKR